MPTTHAPASQAIIAAHEDQDRDRAQEICKSLADEIGSQKFGMWFARTSLNVRGSHLEIATESPFVARWIDLHFSQQLRGAAERSLGPGAEVSVQVIANGRCEDEAASDADGRPSRPRPAASHRNASRTELNEHRAPSAHQRHEELQNELLDSQRTVRVARRPPVLRNLSDFVVGECNRLAYAAARRLVEDPAAKCISPLFVHGDCGVGKTHLLQGVCQRYIELTGRHQHVRYVHCEQFTNEYIMAIRSHKIDQFRQRMRKLDLLAIDDVHFLSNKHRTQSEFLYTLDAIDLSGARIVLASDNHPHQIKAFNQALVSRFISGMVVRVDRPDRPTRLELVMRLARKRGLQLSDAAAQCIVDHCAGSVRELEGAITKLTAYNMMVHAAHAPNSHHPRHSRRSYDAPRASHSSHSAHGAALAQGNGNNGHQNASEQVDEPCNGSAEVGLVLTEQLFRDLRPTPSCIVRMQTIFDIVCTRMGVNKGELLGSGRHRKVVLARAIVAYLARELTTHSYPEIAQSLGRTNHSTVHTADQRLRKQIANGECVQLSSDDSHSSVREIVENLRRDVVKTAGNGPTPS